MQTLISTWDDHHEALAAMSFIHWNQTHKTILGLRGYQQAGAFPPPGPRLDELIDEVVLSRKTMQRYVARIREYPRMMLWQYKLSRSGRANQLATDTSDGKAG